MKKMKRFASLTLALILALALAVPAFAAEGHTITIGNALPGNTYNAYKILDLDGYAEGLQSYKIAEGWADFFAEGGAGAGTLEGIGADKADLTGYVSWKGTDDLAVFAKAAMAYAKANEIPVAGTAKSSSRTDENYNKEETVKITVTDLGWYLVDTTNGSLCSLNATTPDATIEEKNPAPSIKKENNNTNPITIGDVAEIGTGKKVGDPVNFTITVKAQKGAANYVVHDKMGEGLTFKKDVTIEGLTLNKDYTVDYPQNDKFDDGCIFHVNFTKAYLDKITAETPIVIKYSAVINESAVEIDYATNEAKLTYGDSDGEPNSTPWTTTKDKVFTFDFVKHNAENQPLENAVFSLHTAESCTDENRMGLVRIGENVYRVATGEDAADTIVNTVTTPADGKITIKGLANTTYYLKEVTAPEGYNKLEAPVTVEFKGANIETTFDTTSNTWTGIGILNQTGSVLPSTGGIGTTIFYAVGGILVAGAAILLVARKRVNEQ